MSVEIKTPKKLIEVALPLDDINAAAAREKSIRHGHPSTLHLWWARRPLAAARAVIFAQMVNDPGYQQGDGFKYGVNKKEAAIEREKLFAIIRDLVKWENTNNEEVLGRARAAIEKSWRETCELNKDHPQADELFNPDKLPALHDPFAGGGAIPLEAQRLGLEAYASDLNPVAVMINKAMIEIPPKFAGRAPIGPLPEGEQEQHKTDNAWPGATGLAEDVRRYGHWMREQAFKRIGHLYPKVKVTKEMAAERPDLEDYIGRELTVIAWLWARTVKSPNPAFSNVDVPLARSFVLSTKKGKEAWVEPIIGSDGYEFVVRTGKRPKGAIEGTVQRTGGTCLMSDTAMPFPYIREEAKAGRMGERLMAVVAEGTRGRVYLSPTDEMERVAKSAEPDNVPETNLPEKALGFRIQEYGMLKHRDLFTPRQLVALTTFSDLVQEAREKAIADYLERRHPALDSGAEGGESRAEHTRSRADGGALNAVPLVDGGIGATAYGDTLAVYFSFALDRLTMSANSLVRWNGVGEKAQHCFGRQALSMLWDFADVNVIGSATGSIKAAIAMAENPLPFLPTTPAGAVFQSDASTQTISQNKVISTDPPYYDNVGYADLSDFFYVWMRRSLRSICPDLFSTMTVPKAEELVATPYRHGSKVAAESFFMDGMTQAIHNLADKGHPAFPVTIYYAFKQSETKDAGTSNAGWETFLEAVMRAGFAIVGTWPIRTEMPTRQRAMSANALASSIILVCQKRTITAETISRRDFRRQLREEMPEALEAMIGGAEGVSPVAPVDLAQAAIGPGMGIFSRYESVLSQDGTPMSVHDALILINRSITDYLNPDSGNFDNDTLFCDSWFAEYGWSAGAFGQANTLAQAKGTTVDGVHNAGVIESGQGKVRLLRWEEYPPDWTPEHDNRTPAWEATHQLIRALNKQGESGAGALLARMPQRGESIRQLAYHLYTLCERKGWAEDARAYNELITAWQGIVGESHNVDHVGSQGDLGI